MHVDVGMSKDLRGRRFSRIVVVVLVVVAQTFFRVEVIIDSGLAVVEVGWWEPFGVAVGVFAGDPAFFGESVVGAADTSTSAGRCAKKLRITLM